MTSNGKGSAAPGAGERRILMDCGDYVCGNMGDVAMLQVAVERVRALWPDARIQVLTADSVALRRYCPGVHPVPCPGRATWFADRELLGRLHGLLPSPLSRGVVRTRHLVRRRRPQLLRDLLVAKARFRRAPVGDALEFYDAAFSATAIVVPGGGGITDHAARWAHPVLNLLQLAAERGVPSAAFGQGLGPLTERRLLERARAVLPGATLLALREGRFGPALAQQLGVPPGRTLVTGDDAIELAWRRRRDQPGEALGVNLRLSPSAAVGPNDLVRLRRVVQRFATERHARLVGIPISFIERIRRAPPGGVAETDATLDDWSDAATATALFLGARHAPKWPLRASPEAIIDAVGECRVVMTGAYHAAVFALAQGIPVIALTRSTYFRHKMEGLAEAFGGGCELIDLSQGDWDRAAARALERSWEAASDGRTSLLDAAERQIGASRDAYRRFAAMVDGKQAPPAPAELRPLEAGVATW